MKEKLHMEMIIRFSDNTFYELYGEDLNPKQIELRAHMLGIPKMLECEKGK